MARTKANLEKVAWSGRLVAVQPRIRHIRSFDERHHSYHGYVLRLAGTCGDETGEFLVAVGKGAHDKHRFCAGMDLSGLSVPFDDPRLEVAGFYKTSRIRIDKEVDADLPSKPPFQGVPPSWKFIVAEATDAWTLRPMNTRAQLVCGAAGCRSKSLSTTGILLRRSTALSHSATARKAARSTGPGPRARCPAEAA